jgi:tetratricopeptide (TPR) repeat protein
MPATLRIRFGRLATCAFVTLPFAALACGGDGKPSAIPVAEARPVEPVAHPIDSIAGSITLATAPTAERAEDAYEAGRYRDAVELYTARVASTPNDAHAYYMLGLANWKAGAFEEAKDAFDKSIERNPKFAKSYFNQARVLLDLKRAPEALELIVKGREIDATSLDGWRLEARAKSESGDVDGALKTYRELLAHDDADAWGLNNLGVLLMDSGKLQDALRPLARAVQVKPTAPLFQNNLGMALERSGFRIAALRHYELAVRSDSTFSKAVKNAERLKTLVNDTTLADEVNVQDLAEQFRQEVKSWKPLDKSGGATSER